MIATDNLPLGKFFELFSAITHKGEKITVDLDTISVKNLIPGRCAYPLTLKFVSNLSFKTTRRIITPMMAH